MRETLGCVFAIIGLIVYVLPFYLAAKISTIVFGLEPFSVLWFFSWAVLSTVLELCFVFGMSFVNVMCKGREPDGQRENI